MFSLNFRFVQIQLMASFASVLSLLGKELIPVQTAKDLGVTFDSSLSFDCHVVKTVSSCMSSLAQINRVKHVLDKSLLVLVIRRA